MSHARTLGMVQKSSEALAVYDEVCDRYQFALPDDDATTTTTATSRMELGDICGDGRICKHGTCAEEAAPDGGGTKSRSSCDCHAGWTGTTCESNIDDCRKDSCSYASHGVCIDGVDAFTCNCKPGWSGTNCEVKGCNVVDVVGFTHSSLNARFEEDASRLQNGKATFHSSDGQNYIYWCATSNFYLIGSASDWEKNANGDCIGIAHTTPSRADFRKKGVSWNEWDGAGWQNQAEAAVACGSGCSVVEVRGFANSLLNDRYTEDAERVQNGKPTLWGSEGDSYIYWCKKINVYVIGFVNAWDNAEAGSCFGGATTATGADFRTAEWKELGDEETGFQLRSGVTVACATGAGVTPTLLPSPLPLPAPSVDLCAREASAEECAASHKLLVNDFDEQQYFAASSCIASKSLRAGENSDGAGASDSSSWGDLQSNMQDKLQMLKSMDDQISRMELLAAKHAALVAAGSADATLEELQSDLTALVGNSVAHLEDEIAKQTREVEELAEKNAIQLKQAAALQRKVFADELRKQDGVDQLEAEVDSVTVDVDLLLHSMASLEERIDYLHKYGESSKGSDIPTWDLFEETTEEISITQRTLLVQVKRHVESWGGLTSSTQSALTAVLANTTRVAELSSEERTALNAAMYFESAAAAAFTLLDPESTVLTPSQLRVLTDIQEANIGDEDADEEDANSVEMVQLAGLISGTVTPKSLTKEEWMSWNEAMKAQRILTGFSMIWDEDGDGVVASSEKVGLLMDMAWPASTKEGKVLALFRNPQAEVEPSTAREMLVLQFGDNAGKIFDRAHRQRVRRKKGITDLVVDTMLDTLVSVSQSQAAEVAKEANKNVETGEDGATAAVVTSAGIDLVKAAAGKPSWVDIAAPLTEIAAEVFFDEEHSAYAKEAIKHTKRFVQMSTRAAVSPVAAVGGFVADTACDLTKNEVVCDLNGCIKVGLDVGFAAVNGAKYGGAVGAAVAGAGQLLYSAYTGDVDGCVNGLVKIGDKIVKLAEKYLPKTTAFVKKAVEVIKDTEVYKQVSTYVKNSPAGQFASWLTSGNTQRDVQAAAGRAVDFGRSIYRNVRDNVVRPVYNYARDVGRTFSRVATQAYDYGKSVVSKAASGVRRAGRAVVSAGRAVQSAVTSATCTYLSIWCRRQRRLRQRRQRRATTASEYSASGGDPLRELLGDAEMVATASRTVYENADGLFFNTSKGVPVDMGPLVHPDIEAKYRKEPQSGEYMTAAVFTQSLAAYQSLAQKKVELESRIETARYMTENVANYLLDKDHDVQDQVGLALQLMKSRREETVFRVLEQAAEMNNAFSYTSLEPKLKVNLPDSPSLDDLQSLYGKFSESFTKASAPPASTEWKEREATVYYTFNKSTSPEAFRELNRTGSAYFTVDLPGQSKYRNVRLADNAMDAYLYPVDQTKVAAATIEVSKGRFSSFLPVGSAAEPVTFLHTDGASAAAAPTTFRFTPDTCTPVPAEAPPCTSAACSSADVSGTSPAGEWAIAVPESMREAFLPAANLRLAFNVRWVESIAAGSGGDPAMFLNDPCTRGATCFLADGANAVVPHGECATGIYDHAAAVAAAADNVAGGGGDDGEVAGDSKESDGGIIALAVCLTLVAVVGAVFAIVRCKSRDSRSASGLATQRAKSADGKQSRHAVVNEAYDLSAGDNVAAAAAAVDAEGTRCPKCHAKAQFCTCDVRRNTLSQAARSKTLTGGLSLAAPTAAVQGTRAHTMDGRKKTTPQRVVGGADKTAALGEDETSSTDVVCTYISETSGRKCVRTCAHGALYCANYHLCPTLDCGKMKAKAQLQCDDCDGGDGKCKYVSKESGRKCSKLRAPGALYCANFHLCKTPDCNGVKSKAQVACDACGQQQQQQLYSIPLEDEGDASGTMRSTRSATVVMSSADAGAGSGARSRVVSVGATPEAAAQGVIYSQASAANVGMSVYSMAASNGGVGAGAPLYDQATGQPLYDQATGQPLYDQASGIPMYDMATGQPLYDQATGQPLYDQASGTPMYDMAAHGNAAPTTSNIARNGSVYDGFGGNSTGASSVARGGHHQGSVYEGFGGAVNNVEEEC